MVSDGKIGIVDSAREVADNVSIVISIVPAASDVNVVYMDPEHGVKGRGKDAERLILECSTIDS